MSNRLDTQSAINTSEAGVGQRPMRTPIERTPKQSKAWIWVLLGLIVIVIVVLVWFFVFKEDDAAKSGGCKDGEEKVGTKCLVKCEDGKIRVGDKCLVKCADGQVRVGDTCGFLLAKNGNVYTRMGYELDKCTSGWCNNRWMLRGGPTVSLYSNPATTPGDVTEWRSTGASDRHGDRLINDFHLYHQDSG